MDEGIISEIKRRALLLWVDNHGHYANLAAVEAAMTIGASIVMERGGPDPLPSEDADAEEAALLRRLYPTNEELPPYTKQGSTPSA